MWAQAGYYQLSGTRYCTGFTIAPDPERRLFGQACYLSWENGPHFLTTEFLKRVCLLYWKSLYRYAVWSMFRTLSRRPTPTAPSPGSRALVAWWRLAPSPPVSSWRGESSQSDRLAFNHEYYLVAFGRAALPGELLFFRITNHHTPYSVLSLAYLFCYDMYTAVVSCLGTPRSGSLGCRCSYGIVVRFGVRTNELVGSRVGDFLHIFNIACSINNNNCCVAENA